MGPSSSRRSDRPTRIARDLVVIGASQADADALAPMFAAYFNAPRFQYGHHPLFSQGAFTIPAGYGFTPLIALGDGLLHAYTDLGFGDVAPQQILAHEYGHEVQDTVGALPDMTNHTPEESRRIELMADALATYFDTSPRGLSMQAHREQQLLQVSFSIGDCLFDSPSHHGTPTQRLRATAWAYQLQEAQRPRSKVLASASFVTRFDAALPGIVTP